MKNSRKMSAVMALGSLTAAVALLAGSPDANAQAAPGGGSFPGSFLVPGTNTSIKVGGFAKVVGIYDMSARQGDTIAVDTIALAGSANSSLGRATRIHARQSNVSVDTRTPTAYGDLTTFVLMDFFGQNTSQVENQANTQNARVVYAYGTLGPFLAGQWVQLWADTDAIIESVDPTGHVGTQDGLSNRAPQFRYTFAAPGGFSAAVSIENPEAEGFNAATGTPFTTNTLGGIDRYPDLIGRVRLDQAWGHLAVSALYRDLKVTAPVATAGAADRARKNSYGVQLSGHLNTFGKDALKGTAQFGRGLGHYMSNFRDNPANGLIINPATGAAATPYAYGFNLGYTHWWTAALRSSVEGGYEKNSTESSIVTTAAAQNTYDRRHYVGRVNLIWSPVPQVDLGVEYAWARRVTQTSTAAVSNKGDMNRLEVESVFKF